MQVSLKESELVVAVRQHLENQGINLTGKDVKIDFSATRGADGIKATIDIESIDMPVLTPNVQPALRVVGPVLAGIATTPVPLEPFATAGNAADENKVEAGFAAIGGNASDEEPAKKSSLFS